MANNKLSWFSKLLVAKFLQNDDAMRKEEKLLPKASIIFLSIFFNFLFSFSAHSSPIVINFFSFLCFNKVMKIDHHRGPVVKVAISSTSQVLVSGSHDATICLWSLETYELLNLMQFNSPVLNFCLSPDSVCDFLLIVNHWLSLVSYCHIFRFFCLRIVRTMDCIYEH